MTRNVHEGFTDVWFVASIANPDAPTVAEINGGTKLTTFVTKDGLKVPSDRNFVDGGHLGTAFDAEDVGSWGGKVELTCFRDDTTDTAWDTFDLNTAGFIVVGRTNVTPAATEVVEVYPIKSHKPVMMDTAANERQKFTVTCAVTDEPNLDAVVAA